jgi:hypothetical protein
LIRAVISRLSPENRGIRGGVAVTLDAPAGRSSE